MKEISKSGFGIFIGFYNKTNNTNITVKEGMRCPVMTQFFNTFTESAKIAHEKNYKKDSYGKSTTTRSQSLSKLNTAKLDMEVLGLVRVTPNSTRAEIAIMLHRKEATICGAVNRLMRDKQLYVSGRKLDNETQRNVETVTACGA